MINGVVVILIILWIVLIASIILAYHNIRNEQKRFDVEDIMPILKKRAEYED